MESLVRRQVQFDAIFRSPLDEAGDFFLAGGWAGGRAFGEFDADFEEHGFQACGSDSDEHASRVLAFIAEGVQGADGHVGEVACVGDDSLAIDGESHFAFEDVEGFFFAMVDMRRRTAAGRDDRFPHGVLAGGVNAGGEEAVNVADDRDGFAFAGLAEDVWGWSGHFMGSVSSAARG